MASVKTPLMTPPPREDAKRLYNAFKGRGCDASVIIDIVAHRNASQRSSIEQEFESLYSDDINKRLQSELHGHLKKAVLLWMPEPITRDAKILRHALRGTVTHHKAATEIICTRTATQLRQIKQTYFTNFGINLDQDIESEASGDHKRLLLAYLNTTRYEGPEIDTVIIESDAKALRGANDKTWIQIFSERSRAHIAALGPAYKNMYKTELRKAIKTETHGNFEHALLTILQCAENPAFYFAKVLRKAIKGLGTDDSALIRIVVTRAEYDMKYIKAEYKKKYGKTLNDAIRSDTTGHYRTFLLSLLGPNGSH